MALEAAPTGAAARENRAWVLFILVVVYTFNFIDRQIVGILAVPIKEDLGLTDTQLGLMGGLGWPSRCSTPASASRSRCWPTASAAPGS